MLALVDVREHGEYNAAHIPGASSLPRRLLEARVARLVPCRSAEVVLCDDDGRRAALAAATLARMGYTDVRVLDGGINRWASDGLPTEWGMNVPSKAFGERVEVEHRVPTIDATDLQRRLQSGERIVILDTRTPEEYQDFCIPGGRSLPGAELPYRIQRVLRDDAPDTVVVNCAGRTRSIIGARVLQRMGVQNVVSLKNGTAGWTLAGLPLERGADRLQLPEPSPEAERFATHVIAEDGVRRLSVDDLQHLRSTCAYFIDVRTREEYLAGHIPGFGWFPGGQAVQRADDVVALRSAQIVFCCDGVVRSGITASWFRQMGYPNVAVVDSGVGAWRGELQTGVERDEPYGLADARSRVRAVTAPLDPRAVILFVGTSREFAHAHIPGSRWLSRSWLELHISAFAADRSQPLIATDVDGRAAALAASTLLDLGYTDVAMLDGGLRAWQSAGLAVEQGLSGVMQPPDDVLAAGPERSSAEAIEYLRWETALAPQH
jgi:rhodanese-related sulfurtransferase